MKAEAAPEAASDPQQRKTFELIKDDEEFEFDKTKEEKFKIIDNSEMQSREYIDPEEIHAPKDQYAELSNESHPPPKV